MNAPAITVAMGRVTEAMRELVAPARPATAAIRALAVELVEAEREETVARAAAGLYCRRCGHYEPHSWHGEPGDEGAAVQRCAACPGSVCCRPADDAHPDLAVPRLRSGRRPRGT